MVIIGIYNQISIYMYGIHTYICIYNQILYAWNILKGNKVDEKVDDAKPDLEEDTGIEDFSELGFEDDMRKIFNRLKNVSRLILTSATASTTLPSFIKLDNPLEIDFSENAGTVRERMKIYRVDTEKDKLESLLKLLKSISKEDIPERTIIFVNHRESAVRVAEFLKKNKVACALYHGELDQFQREDAISMFIMALPRS